jgi:hypothetical protein
MEDTGVEIRGFPRDWKTKDGTDENTGMYVLIVLYMGNLAKHIDI